MKVWHVVAESYALLSTSAYPALVQIGLPRYSPPSFLCSPFRLDIASYSHCTFESFVLSIKDNAYRRPSGRRLPRNGTLGEGHAFRYLKRKPAFGGKPYRQSIALVDRNMPVAGTDQHLMFPRADLAFDAVFVLG